MTHDYIISSKLKEFLFEKDININADKKGILFLRGTFKIKRRLIQCSCKALNYITELTRPKTPVPQGTFSCPCRAIHLASTGGGFKRAAKSSMDSANIHRGLNPPLNGVSFKRRFIN